MLIFSRPEQLLLQDDPSFLPDFAFAPLDFDFTRLDESTSAGSQNSSALSPNTGRTSPLSSQENLDLLLPTSDTGDGGDFGGLGAGDYSRLGRDDLPTVGEDEGFLPEADFTFDADGNMVELSEPRVVPGPREPPTAVQRPERVPGSGSRAGVGAEDEGPVIGEDEASAFLYTFEKRL